jgi:hypothetical protein
MSDEERKATDVLLSIESKLEALLNHHRTQELNLKILSNKFNSLIDNIPKYLAENKFNIAQPQIKIEVADVSPIPTKGKSLNLLTDSDPIGFRRTSRPETFEDKNKQSDSRESSIQKVVQNFEHANQKENIPHIPPKLNEGAISQITQRIIDKNQKSIFLAEVEIKSPEGSIVHKTRTNSVGKWNATLPVGKYRVSISKRETSNKQKLEIFQDIEVDGNKSSIQLSDLIIK